MSTKSALQSLEKAFVSMQKSEKRDDEFSIVDFVTYNKSKGILITRSTARHKLQKMVQLQTMSKRKVLVAGSHQLLFSPA